MTNLNKNTDSLEKLKSLLKTLFQFDAAELDFGIYRIMNYKRKEIEEFIDKDLIRAVEKEFKRYKTQNEKELLEKIEEKRKEIEKLEKDLGEKILENEEIQEKFRNRPFAKDYLELKEQLEKIEVTESTQTRVFNDLYNFFSRYYEDGDFISKRRYSSKKERYAIPYNGEEVKLYWANFDQYYVKTSEIFKDYEFKSKGWRIVFETVFAKVEPVNIKGERRYFLLASEDKVSVDKESRVCIIQFEYKRLTDKELSNYKVRTKTGEEKKAGIRQDEINAILKDKILEQIKELEPKSILLEKQDDKTLLERHIYKYTKKITSDFFIHKNLKGFLERELNYFIKTEVIDIRNLDERHITRAKVVEGIGKRIIEFLSQIEEFQKMLWEKKKLILKTDYVISLRALKNLFKSKDYFSYFNSTVKNILENEKYREDLKNVVKDLYRDTVSNIFVKNVTFEKNRIKLSYHKRKKDKENKVEKYVRWDNYNDEKPQFISYEQVYIDTKYFDEVFKTKLLEELSGKNNLDDLLDGILIKSENWQALNLILNKYQDKIDLIYIDPPFNTQSAEFLYKDNYLDSSWISMMNDRIGLSVKLLKPEGNFYLHLDENGDYLGRFLMKDKLILNREIIWNITAVAYSEAKKVWIRSHDLITYFTKKKKGYIFNPILIQEGKWDEKKMGSVLTDILSTKHTKFNRRENVVGFSTQKPEDLLKRLIEVSSNKKGIVLDFFLGTGTTTAAAHKLGRKWIGIEMGDYFDSITLPRMKKVLMGDIGGISKDVSWQGGGFFKYHYLEQYEDTLHNIEFLNEDKGKKANELFGRGKDVDEYVMKYILKYETEGSSSLLSLKQFENPFEYKLRVISNTKEELINVDLAETFNYMIGLKVNKYKFLEENKRKYVIVLGERNHRKIAVVWRQVKGIDLEKDKEVIEEVTREFNPEEIYTNGDNLLKNSKFVETEFKALMGV